VERRDGGFDPLSFHQGGGRVALLAVPSTCPSSGSQRSRTVTSDPPVERRAMPPAA